MCKHVSNDQEQEINLGFSHKTLITLKPSIHPLALGPKLANPTSNHLSSSRSTISTKTPKTNPKMSQNNEEEERTPNHENGVSQG